MQAVLDHIEARRQAYVSLPLFDHLRDPGADRRRYIRRVDAVFDHFVAWSAELHVHAMRDSRAANASPALRDPQRARA